MTDQLIIKTDVTDWLTEAMRDESFVANEEELDAMIASGVSTAKIARAAIVSRETGKAPAEIMPENKLLLNAGGQYSIISRAVSRRKVVKINNKNYHVRTLVGQPPDEAQSEQAFTSAQLPDGRQRVDDYILKVIPRYIIGRLLIVRENGGDVRAMAEALKGEIDKIVEELIEKPGSQ